MNTKKTPSRKGTEHYRWYHPSWYSKISTQFLYNGRNPL